MAQQFPAGETGQDQRDHDDRRLRRALRDTDLGEPRVDLWPRLEGAARRAAAARSRRRWTATFSSGARGVVATGLGLALLVAVLGGAWIIFRARAATLATRGAVPDTILLTTYDRQAGANTVSALPAGGQGLRSLLPGANLPAISPDGRLLVFVQARQEGDRQRTAVVALRSDTLATAWSAVVDDRSLAEAKQAYYWPGIAITDERVYFAGYPAQVNSAAPITIRALDRADGRPREEWRFDIGVPGRVPNGPPTLYVTPASAGSARSLTLIVGTGEAGTQSTMQPQDVLARFRLPNGALEARVAPVAQLSGQTPFYGLSQGRVTADGRDLYRVGYSGNGNSLAVSFFDLAAGAIQPALPLPLQGPAGDILPWEQAVSHDGKRLFVLAPTLGQLAIVDLASRQLEQVVSIGGWTPWTSATPGAAGPDRSPWARLWGAIRGLIVQDAAAKIYFQGAMQVSPDGGRIYAIGTAGAGEAAHPAGILVIDTASWTLADRWLPDRAPAVLALGADGRYLYAQSAGNSPVSADSGLLQAFDTASGAPVFEAGAASSNLASLADLYRERYGRSPAAPSGGATGPTVAPLAAMSPAAGSAAITAGDGVRLGVRFTDPLTGKTVAPGERGVRYTPPASVTISLCNQARCLEPAIALQEEGYGVYGTTAAPTGAGIWTIRATARWADSQERSAGAAGTLTVRAAFAGTDGRRYVLAIAAEPDRPIVRQEAAIRAAWVDAETGTPLPDGVELRDGLPPTLEVSFFAAAGVTTRVLGATGHGVYEGRVTLYSTEPWTVRASFPGPGGIAITFETGTLQGVAP